MARIGFACKWIDRPDQVDGIKPRDDCRKYNTGTTTVAWLDRQTQANAEQKLWELMEQNISSVERLVERVGSLDEQLRMVRLGSDILPVYTHASWSYFYQLPDVRQALEKGFARVGERARQQDVRLSFHPGQFCVLASDNPDIVNRSLEEFEYHVDMVRWMGFGRSFQDFKINVHIAGRCGGEGIRAAYKRLSPEARNCITIENEEMKHGLAACLDLCDLLPVVLDIHHHYIHDAEYIRPDDPRVRQVVESWRGTRPTMHYSVSRESELPNHPVDQLPDLNLLLESGQKKSRLRAHSNFYWNTAVNDWALSFLDDFDIMCESKGKNLASFELYEYWKGK